MRFLRRERPALSVVLPLDDDAGQLRACLDSLLGQAWQALELVVVADESTDSPGEVAESYAAGDRRVRIVGRTGDRSLGAARNEGLRHARGEFVTFCDSADMVPHHSAQRLMDAIQESGSDFVTGSIMRWRGDELNEPRWMRRLHSPARIGLRADDHPELLGDVFAGNKVFRRSFWESAGLTWPEGVRYQDQPTVTAAYLRGRFDVLPDIVYRRRVRAKGTSLTRQGGSLADLADRLATKRMSWETVRAEGSPEVQAVFHDRVLPGDLWNYFVAIPGCSDEWWELLRTMVLEFWAERSLVHSWLAPVHRLTGWLVEQDRRDDAARVVEYAVGLGRPADRVPDADGTRIDVPVIDAATVAPEALRLRPDES